MWGDQKPTGRGFRPGPPCESLTRDPVTPYLACGMSFVAGAGTVAGAGGAIIAPGAGAMTVWPQPGAGAA
jgi:hypothetical protein